jgi:hypothetical protein
MSTAAAHPSHGHRPSRLFAYFSFAIMVGGWLAFLVALVTSEPTLSNVWAAIRDLPFLLEGLAWLIGFPFLVGLAIWQSSWDEGVRLIAIAALAVAYTYMFVPREWRR